jgi:hypothetical protein
MCSVPRSLMRGMCAYYAIGTNNPLGSAVLLRVLFFSNKDSKFYTLCFMLWTYV